ncbi:MAG: hypothetical protein ABI759_04705 [Candidatus Solibacter sp.]
MTLLLHNFRKDSRRWWPLIAITLAMLVTLAHQDRWRADPQVGFTEGWLNLLLPLAWAILLVLAVLEEPLVGTRHFWLTRPNRWTHLAGAKLLFALLYVHVSLFVADLYILVARGFSPFPSLPHLLGQQLVLACAVSLPAMALAALVANFTQFALVAATIAAATNVSGALSGRVFSMPTGDWLRGGTIAGIAAAGALGILCLQYRRKGTAKARGLAIAIALAATGVALAPESIPTRARVFLHPIPGSIRLELDTRPHYPSPFGNIPLTITGLPPDPLYSVRPTSLSLSTPDGRHFHGQEKGTFDAEFQRTDPATLELRPRLDRSVFESLKQDRVRITGTALVTLFRRGTTEWMPVNSGFLSPGLGRCTSVLTPSSPTVQHIKVLCESTDQLPDETLVELHTQEDGRSLHYRLHDDNLFGGVGPGGRLSPLFRGASLFTVMKTEYANPASIPEEYVANARIGVTPVFVTGYRLVDFDFKDIVLNKFTNVRRP